MCDRRGMKEVFELMLESSESPEVSVTFRVSKISNANMLASYVGSYSLTYLPLSIMSLTKLSSLCRIQESLFSPTAPPSPHRISLSPHVNMLKLLVSL